MKTIATAAREPSGRLLPYQASIDPREETLKASDLFVRALEAEGVEYIFGIPGEENLDILESLRNSSIELILTRHEQAAGFMARQPAVGSPARLACACLPWVRALQIL